MSKNLRTSGQGLTEYLILLLLVSMGSIAIATSLGGTIQKKLKLAKDHINSDVTLN